MPDSSLRDLALAIRMACCRPGLTEASIPPPVVRAAPAVDADATLRVDADIAPEALADAVASSVAENGAPPASLAVGDRAGFDVEAVTATGRMAGTIVLVTGGAQGFGRGIAEALAQRDARLVIADINDAVGEACVADLVARHGAGVATYCRANVTDLASMQAAVAHGIDTFGGIDLLISNAGILKAGGIEDMEEADFDAVTAVNYKGYFLSVKAVAPTMAMQHRYNPDHFMDIIQVNSKSGLEGSSRNFAYAGGKFGGIGLTQSFALELLESNIKVNAVCPGNYFDGPLWSDPEKGLFVQYLEAGKVAGAKTVDDVKQHYMSRVPMGRGCTPEDVAIAVCYLHEQCYETGQALPVSGGQVMLK